MTSSYKLFVFGIEIVVFVFKKHLKFKLILNNFFDLFFLTRSFILNMLKKTIEIEN